MLWIGLRGCFSVVAWGGVGEGEGFCGCLEGLGIGFASGRGCSAGCTGNRAGDGRDLYQVRGWTRAQSTWKKERLGWAFGGWDESRVIHLYKSNGVNTTVSIPAGSIPFQGTNKKAPVDKTFGIHVGTIFCIADSKMSRRELSRRASTPHIPAARSQYVFHCHALRTVTELGEDMMVLLFRSRSSASQICPGAIFRRAARKTPANSKTSVYTN